MQMGHRLPAKQWLLFDMAKDDVEVGPSCSTWFNNNIAVGGNYCFSGCRCNRRTHPLIFCFAMRSGCFTFPVGQCLEQVHFRPSMFAHIWNSCNQTALHSGLSSLLGKWWNDNPGSLLCCYHIHDTWLGMLTCFSRMLWSICLSQKFTSLSQSLVLC